MVLKRENAVVCFDTIMFREMRTLLLYIEIQVKLNPLWDSFHVYNFVVTWADLFITKTQG